VVYKSIRLVSTAISLVVFIRIDRVFRVAVIFSTVVWNGECERIEYRRRTEVIDSRSRI
jgi:hypothetical protein